MLLGYEEGIGRSGCLVFNQPSVPKENRRSLTRSLPHPSQSSTMVSSCSTLRVFLHDVSGEGGRPVVTSRPPWLLFRRSLLLVVVFVAAAAR